MGTPGSRTSTQPGPSVGEHAAASCYGDVLQKNLSDALRRCPCYRHGHRSISTATPASVTPRIGGNELSLTSLAVTCDVIVAAADMPIAPEPATASEVDGLAFP